MLYYYVLHETVWWNKYVGLPGYLKTKTELLFFLKHDNLHSVQFLVKCKIKTRVVLRHNLEAHHAKHLNPLTVWNVCKILLKMIIYIYVCVCHCKIQWQKLNSYIHK